MRIGEEQFAALARAQLENVKTARRDRPIRHFGRGQLRHDDGRRLQPNGAHLAAERDVVLRERVDVAASRF